MSPEHQTKDELLHGYCLGSANGDEVPIPPDKDFDQQEAPKSPENRLDVDEASGGRIMPADGSFTMDEELFV